MYGRSAPSSRWTGNIRDLTMFNLAIDSKFRGCDVVRVRVENVSPPGLTADRTCVRLRKTGHPVKFELTVQTREAVDAYLKAKPKHLDDHLFESRGRPDLCISTRQYSRLVSSWIADSGLGSSAIRNAFSASHQGHSDLSPDRQSTCGSTPARPYEDREHGQMPRIEVDDALAIAEQVDVWITGAERTRSAQPSRASLVPIAAG
jgi:hypothetical protein